MANEIYSKSWWGRGVCDNTVGWGIVYKPYAGCTYIPSWETKLFIERVEADGGVVESPKCIDEKLNRVIYSVRTEAFIARVIEDSGTIESPQCIEEILI